MYVCMYFMLCLYGFKYWKTNFIFLYYDNFIKNKIEFYDWEKCCLLLLLLLWNREPSLKWRN